LDVSVPPLEREATQRRFCSRIVSTKNPCIGLIRAWRRA
jgi:hypothetical protein